MLLNPCKLVSISQKCYLYRYVFKLCGVKASPSEILVESVGFKTDSSCLAIKSKGTVTKNIKCYKKTSDIIQNILGCNEDEAVDIIVNNRRFENGIASKIQTLKALGLDNSQIIKLPSLLNEQEGTLHQKISQVKGLEFIESFQKFYPLICIPNSYLTFYASLSRIEHGKFGFPSRIHYIAQNLEVDVETLCLKLPKYYFLFRIPYDKIQRMTTIMLENNLDKAQIVRDLWVYKHSEEVFKNRMFEARKYGVKNIKTWMMRCSKELFESVLQKTKLSEEILGNEHNINLYLQNRLHLSESELDQWLQKNPRVTKVNPAKLQRVLDFLFSENFTAQDILRSPRILYSSLKTISQRLNTVTKLTGRPEYLSMICCERKLYHAYLRQLRKNKNSKRSTDNT